MLSLCNRKGNSNSNGNSNSSHKMVEVIAQGTKWFLKQLN